MPVLELLRDARYQAETLGNHVRALELARVAVGQADAEGRFHLRRFLSWLGGQLEDHHLPQELPGRVGLSDELARTVLGAARAHPRPVASPTVGAATALLWDADRSREAFLAVFSVEPAPTGIHDPLPAGCGASFAEAVAHAQTAVFRLLRDRGRFKPSSAFLEGKRFTVGGPPAAGSYVKDGGSIGAAAAAVLFSSWTGTPVPVDVALTGGIDAQGRILPVGALEAKVKAALRERPTLRAVIVPAGSDPTLADDRVVQVETLAELLAAVFGPAVLEAFPRSALDVEGTVRLAVELYEKLNAFVAALEMFEATLVAIDARRQETGAGGLYRIEEFVSLWRAGSCLIHLGDTDGAAERLLRAQDIGAELWRGGDLAPQAYLGFRGTLAVQLRDAYRYEEAEQLLEETLQLQRELRQSKREVAKTLGNLGELWTLMGKHERAEEALSDALAAISDVYPDEVPRELCYLGNLYLRRGEVDRALAFYEKGLAANRPVEYGREANEGFLRYGLVRALVGLGRLEEAVCEADAALALLPETNPYPRQLILKHRGLARIALGEREGGDADLRAAADLAFVRGPLLRFGFSTALAELALELLDRREPGAAEEARALLAQFAALAAEVPGLPADKRSALAEAVAAFTDAGQIARATREVMALFPY